MAAMITCHEERASAAIWQILLAPSKKKRKNSLKTLVY